MRELWRILRYQGRHWRLAALGYGCVVLSTFLGILVPEVVRGAVDSVVAAPGREGLLGTLLVAGAVIVGITLLRGVVAFGQRACAEVVSQRVAYDMRNQLYDHLQRLSFDYHDQAMTGDLMSRLTADVEAARTMLGQALPELIATLLLIAFVAAQLLRLDAGLALWPLLLVPLMIGLAFMFGLKQRFFFFRAQKLFGAMVAVLQENLAGVRVVRAFAREPFEEQKFGAGSDAYRRMRMRAISRWTIYVPLIMFLTSMTLVAAVAAGGPMVMRDEMTLGTLTAFTIYLSMLIVPMRMFGFTVSMLGRASASGTRLFEVLDSRPSILDVPGAAELPPLRGEVRFEQVDFAYGHSPDHLILRGIDFVAQPGQVIALLGPTGAGKSTVINLIPRFYDPSGGRVLLDGHDLREVALDSLRRQIGIVLQESFLFSTTLRENIAYGTPGATDAEIEAAAQAAQAHEFILDLPKGYQTRVGERGVTLSGGQRQRIAIARALLRNPRILILDDATASVDTETEYAIQQALDTLMQGRTTFVIAHRLATLRRADQILVLDEGRIVQRGTHAELVRRPGLYRRIYELYASEQAALRE